MRVVLLVEDNEQLRRTIRRALERGGFVVVDQETAKAALELVLRSTFDAIVTDVGMPEMTGLELLAEIRKHSSVPVLAVTGLPSLDVYRAFGKRNVLDKPAEAAAIISWLRAVTKEKP
jgi:two-component system response regulator MtrA